MRYEYMPVRKVTRRGEALFSAMFRVPEPGDAPAEMKKSKTWRGIRHPVHEKYIKEAELREATKEEEVRT